MTEQQARLAVQDASISELERKLAEAQRDEAARRKAHELEFQACLEQQQKAASEDAAAALENVRRMSHELEVQREVESKLRAEVAASEQEQQRQ
jgi:hypothetical protein